ncbi:MAG: hypothetical protein HYV65_00525 [Candidatus Spechtbacteria bacterium]|nr:hypothetical protein [Candidatus Spechtbacteria bacterium]
MDKLNKLRALWVVAMLVALGTAMWMNSISVQESWFWWTVVWTVRVFFCLPLFVGSSVQLANTFFARDDNLWTTGLYRYMNVLLGYSYGGYREDHRKISICPATWKVGFVATLWIFMFLIWGSLVYVAVIFFIDPTLWGNIFENDNSGNVTLAIMWLVILAILQSYIIGNAREIMPRFAKAVLFLHLATWAIFAIIVLVLEPIRLVGIWQYFDFIGGAILVGAAIAAAVATLIGCTWLAFKAPSFVIEHTPLSALKDGVNNPFCPTIEEDTGSKKTSR